MTIREKVDIAIVVVLGVVGIVNIAAWIIFAASAPPAPMGDFR